MELNNIKTYLAITIVGLTVGVLYVAIEKDLPKTLTIFFITLYAVVALRFILERRHYKKHNAILASTQFLILPFFILLMGNYISPIAFTYEIFNLSSGGSFYSPFNLISISLIIPVGVLLFCFSNYYSGKWPAIAVNRKVRKGRKIPFVIHTTYVVVLLIGFFINWQIDFVGLIFVILYFVYIFRYFVIVTAVKYNQRAQASTAFKRRAPTTASRTSTSTSRRTSKTSTSRSSQRSTTGKPRTTTSSASRSSRSSSVRVDPGINVRTARTSTKKTTRTKIVSKNIFPIGTPKKEEMQCIICYMDFEKKDKRRIILCPNCRYPAHEDEFMSWFKTSKLCARCNQAISTRYVNNPKYRINIKIYIERVIEKL